MVKNAITVFARVKPEKSRKGIANYKIHRRPKKHWNEDFLVLTAPRRPLEYIDNRPESWNFSFHKIFDHEVPQNDIFENVARPIINSVFDGYNATIFAYGQTGSGKTYTISGEPGTDVERGILPRTLQYIFEIVQKNPENLYSVEVAYLEIYNENGYDLLLERKQREAATRLEDLPRVTIQEDESGTMHLKNLSFRIVENEREALQFLMAGDAYRAISETPMNPRSSRSHCIFTIVVSVKKFGSDRYTSAKMHLVDLAGSERVYKCAIQGTILNEAKHINLSLHFLEQVIVCLGQENLSHVPYRNSLLTSILRDSLGGNCLTIMLANLSVSNFNLEETISTCRFSQRVALVKNDVNLIFELDTRSENKLLKIENEKLRKQIEELKKQNISDSSNTGSLDYYKNLVIQRDQEISRLIDISKKEKARKVNAKNSLITIDISRDEKFTQFPSVRNSPRKNYEASSGWLRTKRKLLNSPEGKNLQTSPKKNDIVSPATGRNIQSQALSRKSEISKIPPLSLKNLDIDTKKSENLSDRQTNREISWIDNDDEKMIDNENATKKIIELPKSQNQQDENIRIITSRSMSTKINVEKSRKCSRKEKSSENDSPREKITDFPQNIMKMLKTSCNRRSIEDDENSRSSSKTHTPKSGFSTPNILRNILCIDKNLVENSRIEIDDELSWLKNNNGDDKINENLGKFPLTGDPEVDEEIIAFYRAIREGGSY